MFAIMPVRGEVTQLSHVGEWDTEDYEVSLSACIFACLSLCLCLLLGLYLSVSLLSLHNPVVGCTSLRAEPPPARRLRLVRVAAWDWFRVYSLLRCLSLASSASAYVFPFARWRICVYLFPFARWRICVYVSFLYRYVYNFCICSCCDAWPSTLCVMMSGVMRLARRHQCDAARAHALRCHKSPP